ncbi:MAG: hypothetical protein DMF98_09780 [Acidobacteria bacterium]|nr:MAG: hypothetical protein DMF98_09780 [Acidobacteriota bacterium]
MEVKKEVRLIVEELEQRIAPSATGNPGNNNPPLNNTNNSGNEGTGGKVSTGSRPRSPGPTFFAAGAGPRPSLIV